MQGVGLGKAKKNDATDADEGDERDDNAGQNLGKSVSREQGERVEHNQYPRII